MTSDDRPEFSRLHPGFWIATWFGSGLSPVAPGTAGSLLALPIGWALWCTTDARFLVLAAVLLFPIGVWASNYYMAHTGTHDPGAIVVDEVVGQWLTLAGLGPWIASGGPWWVGFLMAFLLFRLFDIWKPWPIRWLDGHVKGGFGVMIDDVLAGIYAAVILLAISLGVYGLH